jgi:hypothetical protein
MLSLHGDLLRAIRYCVLWGRGPKGGRDGTVGMGSGMRFSSTTILRVFYNNTSRSLVQGPTMKSISACSAVTIEDEEEAPSPGPSCPTRCVEEDDAAAAALSFCITKKGLTPLPLSTKDLPLSISALLSDCS